MTSVIRIKQQFIRVGSTNSPTLEWAMAVVDKIQTDFLFVQACLLSPLGKIHHTQSFDIIFINIYICIYLYIMYIV